MQVASRRVAPLKWILETRRAMDGGSRVEFGESGVSGVRTLYSVVCKTKTQEWNLPYFQDFKIQ